MREISLDKNNKLLYTCLLIIGIILTAAGVVFSPSFVARHFSTDGILDKVTLVRIYVFEASTISLGLIICFYSSIKITKSAFAKKVDEKVETNLIRPWNRYWFAPASLRRLAIFRILIFGFLILSSLFIDTPGYIEGLKNASPEFFQPLLLIKILHLSPPSSPFVLDIIYFLLLLFGAGAMIGFMTRFSILGSIVLYVYIIGMWWSFEGVHHTHPIFIFAMTALLLSPCGKVLSVDNILSRMRTSKTGGFQRNRVEKLESEYALWPIRLVQVLMAIIYFNAGYWKLRAAGLAWADGVTLQFHLIRHYFIGQYISGIGLLMSQHPVLMKALSILTLTFELGFPLVLVFPRLAWIFLPVGLFFHIGTGITMDTWFYHFWFSYVAFINFETLGIWIRDKFRLRYNSRGFVN